MTTPAYRRCWLAARRAISSNVSFLNLPLRADCRLPTEVGHSPTTIPIGTAILAQFAPLSSSTALPDNCRLARSILERQAERMLSVRARLVLQAIRLVAAVTSTVMVFAIWTVPDRLPFVWMLLGFILLCLPGAVATFVIKADNEHRADGKRRVLRSEMEKVLSRPPHRKGTGG